jgi:hypothetical protein
LARQSPLHETLESRFLMSASQPDSERSGQAAESHPQSISCGCPSCVIPAPPAEYRAAIAYQTAAAAFPLADTFKLHSLSTATKRIYLDFDGHLTTNTVWQTSFGYSNINTPAFSLDADCTTFNDAEKTAIQEIWARVTEDFAPFEVDVTTEDPGTAALVKSGTGDTAWGMRVVVGGGGSWMGSAGVAVMNGFGDPKDSPAFAFADQWWKTNSNIATKCISHEVGHTLGLSHDGPGYYQGHGTGPTGWVPIMGSGDKGLTHWSKGEYKNASNKEDDLAIITTKNGFRYRPDDHGNTVATATAMVAGTSATMMAKGIVEQNTDVDLFAFTTTGTIKATVSPAEYGARHPRRDSRCHRTGGRHQQPHRSAQRIVQHDGVIGFLLPPRAGHRRRGSARHRLHQVWLDWAVHGVDRRGNVAAVLGAGGVGFRSDADRRQLGKQVGLCHDQPLVCLHSDGDRAVGSPRRHRYEGRRRLQFSADGRDGVVCSGRHLAADRRARDRRHEVRSG